jgi:hypothetical protein
MNNRSNRFTVLFCIIWTCSDCCLGEVSRVEILRREPFAEGVPFGDIGRYEKLVGRVHFIADPSNAANSRVVDIQLAARNALGVLRLPRVAVPLGTYTGWSLRKREIGAENALLSLAGSYIPLPKTASQREVTGDPRRAILEGYVNFDDYNARYAAAATALRDQRLLLDQDARQLLRDAEAFRPAFE